MSVKRIHLVFGSIIAALLIAGAIAALQPWVERQVSIEEKRTMLIALERDIQAELFSETGYRCCLAKPCSQCVGMTPEHGEGARCDCLEDVVTGKHPCDECIGAILTGGGNPLLAEYFAESIAEGIGRGHKPALMKLIEREYRMPGERQQ
jgi:hypothetical protein